MIIAIASGKGGTGKTTISSSLALSIGDNVQLLDCDVEEPNAHIFIRPDFFEQHSVSVKVPTVDHKKCTACGKCAQVCAFNATAVVGQKVLIYPTLCHNCGSCEYFCPTKAISEINKETGIIKLGKKNQLEFVHGQLNIGEVMAIPVIKAVKQQIDRSKTVIIDAPPGTSCPVIESVKGCDFCLLVTEPTPFGLNDLILAVEVLRKMKIPFGVVINRCDLGNQNTENYCQQEDIPVLMKIPFQQEIAVAYSNGIPLIEAAPEHKAKFCELFTRIQTLATQLP